MQVFIQDEGGGVTTTDSLTGVTPGDGRLYWVNAFEPDRQQVAEIGRAFSLDLSETDLARREFPLVHIYPEYLFMRWDFIARPTASRWLEKLPVDIFLAAGFIITIHRYPTAEASRVFTEVPGYLADPGTPLQTPGEVLYRLLMGALDRYWRACDTLSYQIEDDQKDVFEGDYDESALADLRAHKGQNMELRRLMAGHRHVVLRLIRRDIAFLPSDTARMFLDVYDQLNAIEIEIQNNNDVITSSFDVELNQTNNRLNQVMKKLTIVATIFLPLTFLTGLYGMNFKYMPELGWRHGYVFAWTALILIGIVMYFLARHITREKEPPGTGKPHRHEELPR
ncbi:MAG: magnesium transporter CorA family protein [Actinomycetota bacterium]